MPDPGRGDVITAANPWSFVGMGFEIAVPVMLFTFLGYKADGWLGTEPWLLVVGALLGMALPSRWQAGSAARERCRIDRLGRRASRGSISPV